MVFSIVLLLLLWLVLAALGYQLGFRKPAKGPLRTMFQAVFFFSLFVLVPGTLYMLWSEVRQEQRLPAYGIVPHPSFEKLLAEPAVRDGAILWTYTSGEPAEKILEFYRSQPNRPGWTISSDMSVQLVLINSDRTMIISADDVAGGSVVNFMIRMEENR
jgi:hypothetical protein